jgi:hypothetical protein
MHVEFKNVDCKLLHYGIASTQNLCLDNAMKLRIQNTINISLVAKLRG